MSEPIYKQIGSAMKGVRRKAKVTQDTLAKVLGVSRPSIPNMEAGKQRVSVVKIIAFCDYFDITLSDFFAAIDATRRQS